MFLRNRRGFTLIEMIAVLAVLLILAAIAVPSFLTAINGTRDQAAVLSAEAFASSIDANATIAGVSAAEFVANNPAYATDVKTEFLAETDNVTVSEGSGTVTVTVTSGTESSSATITLGTSTGAASGVAGAEAAPSQLNVISYADSNMVGLSFSGYWDSTPRSLTAFSATFNGVTTQGSDFINTCNPTFDVQGNPIGTSCYSSGAVSFSRAGLTPGTTIPATWTATVDGQEQSGTVNVYISEVVGITSLTLSDGTLTVVFDGTVTGAASGIDCFKEGTSHYIGSWVETAINGSTISYSTLELGGAPAPVAGSYDCAVTVFDGSNTLVYAASGVDVLTVN